jgi:hypothetical protein
MRRGSGYSVLGSGALSRAFRDGILAERVRIEIISGSVKLLNDEERDNRFSRDRDPRTVIRFNRSEQTRADQSSLKTVSTTDSVIEILVDTTDDETTLLLGQLRTNNVVPDMRMSAADTLIF